MQGVLGRTLKADYGEKGCPDHYFGIPDSGLNRKDSRFFGIMILTKGPVPMADNDDPGKAGDKCQEMTDYIT